MVLMEHVQWAFGADSDYGMSERKQVLNIAVPNIFHVT